MPPTDKIRAIAVERLLARIPKARRASLPVKLAEYVAGSAWKKPTIEAGLVYLAHVGHRLDDRGGWEAAAKLPELNAHYATGWKFAHAEPVDAGNGLDVYLWREVR